MLKTTNNMFCVSFNLGVLYRQGGGSAELVRIGYGFVTSHSEKRLHITELRNLNITQFSLSKVIVN